MESTFRKPEAPKRMTIFRKLVHFQEGGRLGSPLKLHQVVVSYEGAHKSCEKVPVRSLETAKLSNIIVFGSLEAPPG